MFCGFSQLQGKDCSPLFYSRISMKHNFPVEKIEIFLTCQQVLKAPVIKS